MRLEPRVFHVRKRQITTTDPSAKGATCKTGPKLYVVTNNEQVIIYVGAAPGGNVRRRLTGVLRAKGEGGHYGYPWKDLEVDVHVASGFYSKPSDGPSAKDFTETMEAELVFLLRTARNSWLSHQVEIHFHDLADQYRRQALRGAEWLLASLVCNGFH